MACEVYVSAPPASSATVTAGQRVQVKLPGQRTREVTLDTGASADTPVRNQGPGPSLPDRRRPSPASRGTITGKLAGCNLGCSSPQSGSVRRGPSGALIQLEPIGMPIPALLMRLSSIIQALAVCCQHCCQAARQRPTDADRGGISAQHTSRDGRPWTMCPLLRIRRFWPGGAQPSLTAVPEALTISMLFPTVS
jgi:hypothetical protein